MNASLTLHQVTDLKARLRRYETPEGRAIHVVTFLINYGLINNGQREGLEIALFHDGTLVPNWCRNLSR